MRAKKIGMEVIQAARKVQDVLPGFDEHRRLVTLVKTMALELERLVEETAQLRAAVLIYREVARRSQATRAVVKASVAVTSSATVRDHRLARVSPVMRQPVTKELPALWA